MTQQRTILITGAGSGLGRDLARLLSRGHTVIATDRDLAAVRGTMSALPRPQDEGAYYELDVRRQQDIERLLDTVGDVGIEVLINNAGLQHVSSLEEFDATKWHELIAVMLEGASRMMRALLPRMRAQRHGRIINIGSIHSLVGSPYKSAYVAAKHGLLGLSKAVALETAHTDITVNTICPAYLRTPLVEAQIAAQASERGIPEEDVIEQIMLAPMPKRCFITAEEVAAAVEFLMMDEARNITGQALTIDGGWTIC